MKKRTKKICPIEQLVYVHEDGFFKIVMRDENGLFSIRCVGEKHGDDVNEAFNRTVRCIGSYVMKEEEIELEEDLQRKAKKLSGEGRS